MLRTGPFAPYTDDDFLDDLARVTRGRTDSGRARILVGESHATMDWLRDLGLRFELMYHRQAYEVDDRYRFWGGLAVWRSASSVAVRG
ncbi:hypothetical protein ACWC5C_20720 [Streptomyces sp. NPDC001700]